MESNIPVPAGLPARTNLTSAEHPWPLAVLSAKMKEYIERMGNVWVEGEVFQYNARPGTKTQFFTLKDAEADVSLTVSMYTHLIPASISAGDKVVVYGRPSFWEKRGTLSLWAQEIRPAGVGDALARIEALKKRLESEGLFADSRKKPLPFLPRRIGLIGGRNAEGTRDVLANTRQRWPSVDFEVREVAVQGTHAAREVREVLEELDARGDLDVIVIARGGGSLEDLLPFSDEELVRAVAAASTPIVSAIGHERDVPILDLVADVRASTPTDAARRIVPDVAEELRQISALASRNNSAINRAVERAFSEFNALCSRPVLARPTTMISAREEDLSYLRASLRTHANHTLDAHEAKLARSLATLRTLSPLSTLDRGYSILVDASGAVVSDSSHTVVGDNLHAVLAAGTLEVTVESGTQGKANGT